MATWQSHFDQICAPSCLFITIMLIKRKKGWGGAAVGYSKEKIYLGEKKGLLNHGHGSPQLYPYLPFPWPIWVFFFGGGNPTLFFSYS